MSPSLSRGTVCFLSGFKGSVLQFNSFSGACALEWLLDTLHFCYRNKLHAAYVAKKETWRQHSDNGGWKGTKDREHWSSSRGTYTSWHSGAFPWVLEATKVQVLPPATIWNLFLNASQSQWVESVDSVPANSDTYRVSSMHLHHVKARDKWDQINSWNCQTEGKKRLFGLLIQMAMLCH